MLNLFGALVKVSSARSIMYLLLLLFLISFGARAEYDENIAKKMLVLAASVYSPNPEKCLSNRFENATV